MVILLATLNAPICDDIQSNVGYGSLNPYNEVNKTSSLMTKHRLDLVWSIESKMLGNVKPRLFYSPLQLR